MKKIKIIAVLLIGSSIFATSTSQVHLNFKANIGAQPIWGPIGYNYAEYYYLPDIDVFYYVPEHQYIYMERGYWTRSTLLPARYQSYNLYSGYKVVLNVNRPYHYAESYRKKYANYKDRHDQEVIRNSRDPRYFIIKNHPEHEKWEKQNNSRKNDNNRINAKNGRKNKNN